MTTTFQDRLAECIRICGTQKNLADRASSFAPKKISQQVIQYLASKKHPKRKLPPAGSRLTVFIAMAAGLNPHWLATGLGVKESLSGASKRMDGDGSAHKAPGLVDGDSEQVTINLFGMEISKDAVMVAKMWMELPANLRGEFRRQLEAQALAHTDNFIRDSAVAIKMARTKATAVKKVKATNKGN